LTTITPELRAKLEQPSFWFLATLRNDGTANVTPMWIDVDGDHVLLNTAIGRFKERHVRRDPRITLTALDPENPYSFTEIWGRVVGRVEGEPAFRHIDKLAKKYLGQDTYPYLQPGEQRVILQIELTEVHVH
jgi:PPOX class probable F420-dependent enzyme